MVESFFERPILNSPYEVPKLHHALDQDGQPLDLPPVAGRRRSELITPVPKPKKKKNKGEQKGFVFEDEEGSLLLIRIQEGRESRWCCRCGLNTRPPPYQGNTRD
jgi:hypothetical protein